MCLYFKILVNQIQLNLPLVASKVGDKRREERKREERKAKALARIGRTKLGVVAD